MSSNPSPFRFRLLRWHRRAGLLVALFVLVLAITGLLLNHSDELELDEQFISSGWLLHWYGVEHEESISYPVGDQWVSEFGGAIYLGSKQVESCSSGLVGSTLYGNELIVACRDSVSLLTQQGQVIERVDATLGLPVPIDGLAMQDSRVFLSNDGKLFELDLDQLEFNPAQADDSSLLPTGTPPAALLNELRQQSTGHSIHWERVMLDLHSGRLFGRAGVYLFDLAAVLLIFLAGSGVYYWASKPASRR